MIPTFLQKIFIGSPIKGAPASPFYHLVSYSLSLRKPSCMNSFVGKDFAFPGIASPAFDFSLKPTMHQKPKTNEI